MARPAGAGGAADVAPADVSMMSQISTLKGMEVELWAPLDLAKIPNAANVKPEFVTKYPDGRRGRHRRGDVVHHAGLQHRRLSARRRIPGAFMWDPSNADKLGLLALVSNSFLLEITAKTFFAGDPKILDTEEGILKVMDKIAELKPNVKLWYRDEAQFEQALKSGEIPMGQYYHDVTGLAAADGHPVRSTFPKEGGVNDAGSWVVSKASDKAGGGACLHRLHVQAGDAGAAVAQGRHVADREARGARPDRRGIRRGVLGDPGDHPALRPLPRPSRTG